MKPPTVASFPTRREFCARAVQSVSLSAAALFAACGGSPTGPSGVSGTALSSVSGSVSGRTVSVNIDGGSPLSTVGSLALVQTALGSFLLARTAQDTVKALSAACTHEACAITASTNGQFLCPCHGSRFTTDGAVLNGPANRSLAQYATSLTGTQLTFTV